MFMSMNLFVSMFISSLIPILSSIIYLKWFSSSSKELKNLPPSPLRLPIIGNFHQVSKNHHRSFWKLANKHGPLMLMHLGSVPVVVVSNCHAAREVLKTHELSFLDRGESGIIKQLTYGGKDIVLSDYGEYWRQLKSFVVLHLLSKERVASFKQVREEEMDLIIDKLGESCGLVVNFSDLIFSLTINVLCRLIVGTKENGNKITTMVAQLKQLVVVVSVGQFIPWLSWVDQLRGVNEKVQKIAREVDEFLEGIIEEHSRRDTRESTASKPKLGIVDQGQCFIDILLEKHEGAESRFVFSRDTIKAFILDIFTGTTDMTFTTLEWAFSELVRNPRVMKTLQNEVKLLAQGKPEITEDDIEKLEYFNAVLKETLRLHPPAPIIPRASTQDVKLMGYDIQAKTRVFINIWAIGRDPVIWEEPEEFTPERFLNSSIDYKGSNFEFIPFGSGRRGCPGIQFSTTLMKLALANVVYKFDLSLPGGESVENLEMSESTAFTVHRKNPLLLVATRRSE